MNLKSRTQEICCQYNIKPSRSKGQNFLINEEVYDKIIESADLNKDDVVLEVGPGLGFLTAKLAKKVKKVIAVELDDKLADFLKIGFGASGVDNVEIVNENVLDFNTKVLLIAGGVRGGRKGDNPTDTPPAPLERGKYKVVANLPYNITSVFLRKFLENENKPESMVLMLQKEVAERIVAKPGDMSLLAVSVQFYSEPEIMQYVSKEDFYPQPEVDSAVIQLQIKNEKIKIDERIFFRLVKFGFSSKRKMLKNNLAGGYHITQSEAEEKIKKAGFSPKIRAQELGVADWIKLLGEF